MHILTADQVRAWDEFTILNEPIASINLMERAAEACVTWLFEHGFRGKKFIIFCGKGNNGGDGLAIARMLSQSGSNVQVYVMESGHPGTSDYQMNLQRLHPTKSVLTFVTKETDIREIEKDIIILDALIGTGLNRPLEGLAATIVEKINHSKNNVISIDIPSGLSADHCSGSNIVVRAKATLSFQCYKPAFIVAENDQYIGDLQILNIGLSEAFLHTIQPAYNFVDLEFAKKHFRPRNKFAHKGNFGHALLVAGSYGKIGAAILAARATLVAGVGLLTVHIPQCGYGPIQTAVPEAMVHTDKEEHFNSELRETDLTKFAALGIGPGLGTIDETSELLREILREYGQSMVIDADALNLISNAPSLLSSIPGEAILTPHPKEFERLAGVSENGFARLEQVREFALKHNCVVVMKGHYTCTATQEKLYINSTGNAGMAKGGSGDVLTGIITALLAQGYSSEISALLGVFLHGLAADIALTQKSMESMLASDIIDSLPKAFRCLY